jgi:hypothetical protein
MKYWKEIGVGVFSALILAVIFAGWNVAAAKYDEFQKLSVKVTGLEQQVQQVKDLRKLLQQVARDVRTVKKGQLTISGKAFIVDGSADCCMMINIIGRASHYAEVKTARVINLSHPDNPSTEVKIAGRFRNVDPNYVAKLSSVAGNRIEARIGKTIDIRIEPLAEPAESPP